MPSQSLSYSQFQHSRPAMGDEEASVSYADPMKAPVNRQTEVSPLGSKNLASYDATLAWRNPKSMNSLPQPMSKQTFSSWRDFDS
jgi:hypothetical protein